MSTFSTAVLQFCVLTLCSLSWAQSHPTALSQQTVDPQRMIQTSVQILNEDPYFHKANKIAQKYGYVLATYGGTSREILTLSRELNLQNQNPKGDPNAPRTYLDWHNPGSDLDLLLIQTSQNSHVATEVVKKEISSVFPRKIGMTDIDINEANTFFQKFNPDNQPYEAVSNIALSNRGLEKLPNLDLKSHRAYQNLSDWGVAQISQGFLDFEFPQNWSPSQALKDPYGLARQVFRWVRLMSEYPSFKVKNESLSNLRLLMGEILQNHKTEVIKYLQSGTEELQQSRSPKHLGGKLVMSLEKAQLYSHDSVRTREILDSLGITKLAEEAGVSRSVIYEPLPVLTEEKRRQLIGERTPTFGEEIVLHHRSSVSATQNISSGALWISNGSTALNGKTTTTSGFKGIYAHRALQGSLSYGLSYAEIRLRKDAVQGVDFELNGDIFIILTRNAIAIDPNTKALAISKWNRTSIINESLERLKSIQYDEVADEIYDHRPDVVLIRSLLTLLDVENIPSDRILFQKLLQVTLEDEDSAKISALMDEVKKIGDPSFQSLLTQLFIKYLDGPNTTIQANAIRRLPHLHEDSTNQLPDEVFTKIGSLMLDPNAKVRTSARDFFSYLLRKGNFPKKTTNLNVEFGPKVLSALKRDLTEQKNNDSKWSDLDFLETLLKTGSIALPVDLEHAVRSLLSDQEYFVRNKAQSVLDAKPAIIHKLKSIVPQNNSNASMAVSCKAVYRN